ncbi:MAG: Gfo/Idh/MocA family oxidoreductase [Candidatus Margulisbacteria bacterium]|nr:Gfo/Idh/MocA family oxidoreductase [Candidatus Margulisiibacteriota bacterium]
MITIAQVGVGRWGKNLLRNYMQMDSCRVKLVCEADPKHRQEIKKNYPQVKVVASFNQVLKDPEIDAVVIATPAATHFKLGMKALTAGKHIFIEKPIVLKTTQLKKLIALANEKNKVLMEGHLLLYHGAVNCVREAIKSGKIGDLYHVYFRRTNLGSIRFTENALWDFGPHDISVVYHLIDEEPEQIAAHGVGYLQEGIEEVVFTFIKFKSGKFAHLQESWLDPHKDRKIVVVGSKGMIIMDELATDGKVKFIKKRAEAQEGEFEHERFKYHDEGHEVIEYEEVEPLRLECLHFLECIENTKTPRSGGENSVRVLKTLEMAQKSLEKDGKPIKW